MPDDIVSLQLFLLCASLSRLVVVLVLTCGFLPLCYVVCGVVGCAATRYQQWRHEDFVVVAFAYDPVSNQEKSLFLTLERNAHLLRQRHPSSAPGEEIQPAASLDPSARASRLSAASSAPSSTSLHIGLGVTSDAILLLGRSTLSALSSNTGNSTGAAPVSSAPHLGGDVSLPGLRDVGSVGGGFARSPTRMTSSIQGDATRKLPTDEQVWGEVECKSTVTPGASHDMHPSSPSVVSAAPVAAPPTTASTPSKRGELPRSSLGQSVLASPSKKNAATKGRSLDALLEDRLHRMQSKQIFLGLVASRVVPKHKVWVVCR